MFFSRQFSLQDGRHGVGRKLDLTGVVYYHTSKTKTRGEQGSGRCLQEMIIMINQKFNLEGLIEVN